ncbi:putative Longin domain, v-SNARE, coiled-coil domain-containing protein [Dioscorea sansibarensis]
MAILYSSVTRGSVILAEFSAFKQRNNCSLIAYRILEKISGDNDTSASYSHEQCIFHIKRANRITVLCVADNTANRKIPFAFLEDIHARFMKKYGGDCDSACANAMNDEFSRILRQQMEHYSHDPLADKINRIKEEISQVRNVMMENIERVLERGERMEMLVNQATSIQGNAACSQKNSHRYKDGNNLWWQAIKLA